MLLRFDEIIDYLLILLIIFGFILIPIRVVKIKKPDKRK